MDSLKELIGLAIYVASERKEDVTIKEHLATTDVIKMGQLEQAIFKAFGVGSKDIISSGNLEVILDTAVVMLSGRDA